MADPPAAAAVRGSGAHRLIRCLEPPVDGGGSWPRVPGRLSGRQQVGRPLFFAAANHFLKTPC